MPKDLLSFFEVRKQLARRLQALSESQSVVKAVPIAFPVDEVEHTVCQLVTEPLGLAQRYVAEAVVRFQPITALKINELLGLGEAFISQILENLINDGADLYRDGLIYIAGPQLKENVTNGTFERKVVQRRRFLVNGMTDKLLPIEFLKGRRDYQLFLGGERDAPMEDRSGAHSAVSVRVGDRLCFGREDLLDLVRNGDTVRREEAGIPKGATGLDESIPAVSESNWVLAFIFVRRNGSVEVLAAGDSHFALHDSSCQNVTYWQEVCVGPRFSTDRLAPDFGAEEMIAELTSAWPNGVEATFDQNTNQVVVKIAEIEVNLPLSSDLESDESSAIRRLRSGLVAGTYWDPKTLAVVRLNPGDARTARRVSVLRAVQALQRKLRGVDYLRNAPAPFQLSDWWNQWLTEFRLTLKSGIELGPVDLKDLLLAAGYVRDTDFIDKLDWINDENG